MTIWLPWFWSTWSQASSQHLHMCWQCTQAEIIALYTTGADQSIWAWSSFFLQILTVQRPGQEHLWGPFARLECLAVSMTVICISQSRLCIYLKIGEVFQTVNLKFAFKHSLATKKVIQVLRNNFTTKQQWLFGRANSAKLTSNFCLNIFCLQLSCLNSNIIMKHDRSSM